MLFLFYFLEFVAKEDNILSDFSAQRKSLVVFKKIY